jgi:hypothetical protein
MQSDSEIQPEGRKRDLRLSKDGKWRSFPKAPHLLQYVSNGNYYGRIKVGGKIIRQSLETTVWTVAKLRLADFLVSSRDVRSATVLPKFGDVVAVYKREIENDVSLNTTIRLLAHDTSIKPAL